MVRYGVAVLATAIAALLQALLIPVFGAGPNASPFMVLFAAVMVAAWFGGIGPGMLATVLSTLAGWYLFLSPQYSFAILEFGQGLRLLVFALEGALISWLVGAMHSARRWAETNALEVYRSDEQLRARTRQQEAVADLGRRAIGTTGLPDLMQGAVETVAGVLGVEYSEVLELLPGDEELLLKVGVGWRDGLVGRATIGAGRDSQAGYTLASDGPVVVRDLRSERRFRGSPLLHEHGVVSGMSVIIRSEGRPFGVLGAHTTEPRRFTEDDVNFLRGIANVLAAVIARKRIEERQRFLAETGALLSSSLDYRTTLASVARLTVPTLADWCAVDILEHGSVERLAVEHEDPEKVALALELRERYPTDVDSPGGVPKVLRTGTSEFYPEVTSEMLETAARDEEHLGLLREIGFTSAIVVPMMARGRTLGAITLVSAESGRRYGQAELNLAEELARRAALAVDNARLYQEAQREIAEREWIQAELRSSRDELAVILGGIAEGVTAQDPTGGLIYANETAARLVGYPSAREFLEAPLEEVMKGFEVFDEQGRPFPLANLPGRRALGGGEGEEVLRFRVVATGEERWSIVRAMPVFDEDGKVRMAVNIFREITERKQAEETLRRIREAERERLARDLHDGVLQDLSYTTAVVGLIMLESEDLSLKTELQRVSDAVRHAAQGLRDVVNDLRLEEERDRPLPELVEYLVERNRTMARGAYEISLTVGDGFPQEPLGEVGTQLLRAMQEALTNARRHSGARHVSVTLGLEGGDLLVEVADDGRGFGPGTTPGVGMSSMRERAEVVGGELEVESEAGKGARVRLRAPVPR